MPSEAAEMLTFFSTTTFVDSSTMIPYKPSVVVLPLTTTLLVFALKTKMLPSFRRTLLFVIVTLPTDPMTTIPVAVAVCG